MRLHERTRDALLALLLTIGGACSAVGPDYAAPELSVPVDWREADGYESSAAELAGWWRNLGDPVLDELVERALHGGIDLREAVTRIDEARALRGIAKSELFPAIDGNLSYERRTDSENTVLGEFVPDAERYGASLDATWEIDLWGRIRRSIEAADAELAATVDDARAVAVSLAAETAATYVELRTFQQRVLIARTNVRLQQETLEVVAARVDAGLVGERDLAQARANLETTRARVPALEIGLRAAENRLAVLLGIAPGNLPAELASELAAAQPIPAPPATLAVGAPADLLRRRADVRSAERALAAETARIGMAEAELYPELSLFGFVGIAAEDPDELFSSGSDFFGFGPTLRWNLFRGDRLRQQVEAQEARAARALLRWEGTVLMAFEEAENAMTAFLRERARREPLAEAVSQSQLAVGFARTQYEEGLADFQPVLDSERALAELEDVLAQNDAAIAARWIALYKALGGGWEAGLGPLAAADPAKG